MTVHIAVIGLHQVGASIGLALGKYKEKIHLTGFDEDTKIGDRVAQLKVFTRVERDLAAAVREANLVVLAVPADTVHEYLQLIAPLLPENAQVIDTSLLHQGMDEAAAELLGKDHPFISATPILNPAYLDTAPGTDLEAHEDLFEKGALLICSGVKTAPEMIKVAADLAELLGTHAYFTEPFEADAILAEVELLPRLTAAALVNTAATNPGWSDSRRVAGSIFNSATGTLQGMTEIEEYGKAALQARENTLRALDRFSGKIAEIRAAVEKNDAAELKALLSAAITSRNDWLAYKLAQDWNSPDGMPEEPARESPGRLLWQGFKRKGK
jgi:prephenate dehydrogenase